MTARRAFLVSCSAALRLSIELLYFGTLSPSWIESLVDVDPESGARILPNACLVACHWSCNCWGHGGCGLVGGALRRAWTATTWLIVLEEANRMCMASEATCAEVPRARFQARLPRVLGGRSSCLGTTSPSLDICKMESTYIYFPRGSVLGICTDAEQFVQGK